MITYSAYAWLGLVDVFRTIKLFALPESLLGLNTLSANEDGDVFQDIPAVSINSSFPQITSLIVYQIYFVQAVYRFRYRA